VTGARSAGPADEADGPRVGAWFTGRNETPERTWESHCQVVAADPGREFGGQQRLGAPGLHVRTRQRRFGAQADAEIVKRHDAAKSGIPATLAAIKKAAEAP
jgi:hypothetical protein